MEGEKLYYSNGGRGPLVARIISIQDGIVTLERKRIKGHDTWMRFELPESFFRSESCGWKERKSPPK